MTDGAPRPVVVDHNFPRPIVEHLAAFGLFPDVEFHFTRDVDEDLAEWDDHELIIELHRRGFSLFLTGDHKMLRNAAVLVAIEQTRMTVLAVRSSAHDMVLSTGVLLRDLMPVISQDYSKGLIYEAHPSRIEPKRSLERLREVVPEGASMHDVMQEHRRPLPERRRYKPGDPRRIV